MERMTGMGFNFTNEDVATYVYSCLGLPKPKNVKDMISDVKEKEIPPIRDKDGNELPPRKYKEHQTDEKEPYNQVYESEGMK